KVGHELERMGFTVEPVELPLEGLADPTLWAAALGALPIRDLETVHPMLRDQVVTGRVVKAVALEMLNHRFHQRSRALRLAVNEYDAVLLPVLPTLAKPIGFLDSETIDDLLGWLAYTYPANIAGLPSVAFPADRSADGLPIGAQLMGPLNHDEQLLELVAKWEVARGLPHPTAPLSPGA
ncbi:MAG TPA: amidase family protein, partial [Acidimicrobiia bacterium]